MGWDWTLDKDLLVQIDMILVHPAQHITGAVLHSAVLVLSHQGAAATV